MVWKVNDTNFKRKWKRSLIFTQYRKVIEEELTYERFVKELELGLLEFSFLYNDIYIDIAYHYNGTKKVYELNLNYKDGRAIYQEYDSPQSLLTQGFVNGYLLKDIWSQLQN